jgi:hypothetical protein
MSLGTGATKRVIDLAVDHTTKFGRQQAEFELIEDKLAWMVSYLFGFESMAYLTTGLVDAGVPDYSLESAGPALRCESVCVLAGRVGLRQPSLRHRRRAGLTLGWVAEVGEGFADVFCLWCAEFAVDGEGLLVLLAGEAGLAKGLVGVAEAGVCAGLLVCLPRERTPTPSGSTVEPAVLGRQLHFDRGGRRAGPPGRTGGSPGCLIPPGPSRPPGRRRF